MLSLIVEAQELVCWSCGKLRFRQSMVYTLLLVLVRLSRPQCSIPYFESYFRIVLAMASSGAMVTTYSSIAQQRSVSLIESEDRACRSTHFKSLHDLTPA